MEVGFSLINIVGSISNNLAFKEVVSLTMP